jgi:hypothetical protein
MRLPGYRTLGLAWAAVLALLAGGVGTLAWLGPLPGEDTALVRVSGGVATRGPAPAPPPAGALVDEPTSA